MAGKVRVLHVTGQLAVGGVDELLWITAKENQREKYELGFCACASGEGFIGKQIEKLGYPIFSLHATSRVYDLRVILRLLRVFKTFRPHIVNLYFKVSILGRIAAKLAGVPIIICNEMDMAWEEYSPGLRIAAAVKRHMDFMADKIVACSQAVRSYWERKKSSKYTVIHLPIDLDKFANNDVQVQKSKFKHESDPLIGMVSRLFPGKGHQYLIQAMSAVASAFPSARLRIIGTGPVLDEMKTLSQSLRMENTIEFTGFVEDLNAQMQELDVFVLPSLTEGFPLSVMEAMACGLPVVATPVGGIPEMIEQEVNGLLVPPCNVEELAGAIIQILSDPRKARRMGKRGRQKVFEQYSPQQYMNQFDALYQNLLADKKVGIT